MNQCTPPIICSDSRRNCSLMWLLTTGQCKSHLSRPLACTSSADRTVVAVSVCQAFCAHEGIYECMNI